MSDILCPTVDHFAGRNHTSAAIPLALAAACAPEVLRDSQSGRPAPLLPALGHLKLSGVTRNAVQDLVDRLVAEGASASTVRNAGRPTGGGEVRPSGDEELVFGRSGRRAMHSDLVTRRARTAWSEAGVEPIGLHECRHTYAAFMIAAGVNPKALSTYMGHSSITITLDRYGHLMPPVAGLGGAATNKNFEWRSSRLVRPGWERAGRKPSPRGQEEPP